MLPDCSTPPARLCCLLTPPARAPAAFSACHVPLTFLSRSSKDGSQIYTFLNAMLAQYDNEDFDLGIKQFMIEQARAPGRGTHAQHAARGPSAAAGRLWLRLSSHLTSPHHSPSLSSLPLSPPSPQAIQQEMEDGLDKKGDAKDFEEKLAEQLFADEGDGEKITVRPPAGQQGRLITRDTARASRSSGSSGCTASAGKQQGQRQAALHTRAGARSAAAQEATQSPRALSHATLTACASALPCLCGAQLRSSDVPPDGFTTEKMEEAAMVMGPQSSLRTAWRVTEHLTELAYTQLW